MAGKNTKKLSDPGESPGLSDPRLRETRQRVLRATLALSRASTLDGLTVENIAAKSGVAKTTIYRQWPNVAAVVMEAFLSEVNRRSPIQTDKGSAEKNLRKSMKMLAATYDGRVGKLLRSIVGHAQLDDAFRKAVQKRWVEPRRQVARAVIEKGIASGELRAGLDSDVVLDALYGPLYHRLLVPYDSGPTDAAYVDMLIDLVFGGLRRRNRQ